MPVSHEYAARTPCRDHTLINTQPLRGSLRRVFYSQCEQADRYYQCKYSHTIFNTNRVQKLGSCDGRTSYVVRLDYGYGFERYGTHDGCIDGWEVRVTPSCPHKEHVGRFWGHRLPKVLLAEEARAGLRKPGDALTHYEKTQSLCRAHYERNACQKPDCKFDHNLIDCARLQKLARWVPEGGIYHDALTVECHVVEGRTTWKIILKEDAFASLEATNPIAQRIPSRPYSHEGAELLDVVRHVEQVVGLTATGT